MTVQVNGVLSAADRQKRKQIVSLYQVRFVREADDPDEAHIVVEVDAPNHDEALRKAPESKKDEVWLAQYGFWSVEVNRF
jgi:hypothetical protein